MDVLTKLSAQVEKFRNFAKEISKFFKPCFFQEGIARGLNINCLISCRKVFS